MRDRAPWGLILIVAVFCLLSAIYSVIVPLFEAPDEVWHFSFIQALATQRALPVQSTESKDIWLREAGQSPLYLTADRLKLAASLCTAVLGWCAVAAILIALWNRV